MQIDPPYAGYEWAKLFEMIPPEAELNISHGSAKLEIWGETFIAQTLTDDIARMMSIFIERLKWAKLGK